MISAAFLAKRTAIALGACLLTTSAFSASYSTPVRDVENPARTPLADSGTTTVDPGFVGVFGTPIAEVPVNTRLVIEFVSVSCTTDAGNPVTVTSLGIVEAVSGGTITHNFQIPIRFQGTGAFGSVYVGALATRLYADRGIGGVGVISSVQRTNGTGTTNCSFSVSGHTINI
ncbi:MAG: hypothetical protein H6964_09910 [Chromatiaceae bacterium]|nr:hypothetical protein [Gammaproteobacteria bacterium]MCB1874181.1 hypothetical protein [Gammaproteobacteria bacterium]MCB1878757.1 hypothetical protein [Gammaproteobacteria bacterium]MCP5447300.1 hypothetical protein [Chromatiaceae bacterium]